MYIKGWRLIAVPLFIYYVTASAEETESPARNGPIIIPQKNEIILEKGTNFTLTCRSNREIQFKQQEPAESLSFPFETIQKVIQYDNDSDTYEIALDLINLNEHAVGFYACFDSTINVSDVLKLNTINEEPINTEHITYIYVYVNGCDHLFAPMTQIIEVNDISNFLIRCRPTSPDIKVELESRIEKKKFKKELATYSTKIGYKINTYSTRKYKSYRCLGQRRSTNETIYKNVAIHLSVKIQPKIFGNVNFLAGETFSLSCSAKYQKNVAINLEWRLPHQVYPPKVINETNENNVTDGTLYKNITIINATKDDEGLYVCIANKQDSANITKRLTEPFLYIKPVNDKIIKTKIINFINMEVECSSYPAMNLSLSVRLINCHDVSNIDETKTHYYYVSVATGYPVWDYSRYVIFKDSQQLFPTAGGKYEVRSDSDLDLYTFIINKLNVYDTANYTIRATNGYLTKNVTYDYRRIQKPVLQLDSGEDIIHTLNSDINKWVTCNATGYPTPKINWFFNSLDDDINMTHKLVSTETVNSLYQVTSLLDLSQLQISGNVTCSAENSQGNYSASRKVIIYEFEGGFGIKDKTNATFVEGADVTLTCIANLYTYDNATWLVPNQNFVVQNLQDYNHIAELKLTAISVGLGGEYTCIGYDHTGGVINDTITIVVEATKPPTFLSPLTDEEIEVYRTEQRTLTCQASGVPRPYIEWYKDGEEILASEKNVTIKSVDIDFKNVSSSLTFTQITDDYTGKYSCKATNDLNSRWSSSYNVMLHTKFNKAYLGIIALIFIFLLLLILYLIIKIRKEKMFRKELAKAGLLNFKKGVTKSLNPDLGIDEQAELLPYDERFEFPVEKLKLGKQLGSGAFGVVYKAEARGIINAEKTETVAVKMVKKTADNLAIKALASELKIMVHMGKHVNIVNLLGACTKNVGKRELSVIVEYCKFGNIHNYLIRHREVFIDNLSESNEANFGNINRGFSCSSGSSGINSDYMGSNHTQNTDHTFLNTGNSQRSGVRRDTAIQQVELGRVSESNYVQPLWRSNYESDYSYDAVKPRTLTTRDLICWGFQIARGMEYLANRKVLHGDLAARNILLAEDGVVKICDFGLARSIYKTDEYQKKESGPLPVKWLAIECMRDRIFSTQSDVWSFGIVLWELFSLAKTPYPNISPCELLDYLQSGKRLHKPRYADDRIYEVIMQCWEKKPTARPTFSELQEKLGTFLEDTVRNHYVDLNTPCININIQAREGHEDYLAMVRAPDYTSHVMPSPHNYVNDVRSFFPPTPTLPEDEEGYLQMSPSKRQVNFDPQKDQFNFDSRKIAARSHDAVEHGSELTPMLTLNNLPTRSGSESDHEGNSLPYSKACPRIEEETDEVFETKQNNLRNCLQNIAVTNPTYLAIDIDVDAEKKPQTNSYVNIANGLVK